MSSLLSFAWKNKSKGGVPDIAPATSCDDALTPTASMRDDDDETFYSLEPETPPTPDGLKPRKSLLQVRRELGVPTHWSLNLTDPPTLPMLPPRVVHSPQITNSSFYSKSSSELIAESPNLAAPTTAVGALVAGSTCVVRPFLQHHVPMLPPRPWELDEQLDDEVHYQRLDDDDSSHSWEAPNSPTSSSFANSQVGLTEGHNHRGGYNFDPIMQLNVSAISNPKDDHSSLHSLTDYRGDYCASVVEDDEEEQKDNWFLQRKRLNQRSHKERLILDCVERLRSDINLVRDIENSEIDGKWFIRTDMDEGLLCGFPTKMVDKLYGFLQSILTEMDTARPEEFFLSPSQIEDFGETHQELRQALRFVQKLLTPDSERQWECKFEIRSELSSQTEANSPDTVRGGDTSLFSLPEDSMTPHTSNLSMATTITTKPPSPQRRNKDVVVVLKTVALLTTLVQRLSLACTRLIETDRSGSPEAIRATEEMKRFYLQLLTLSSEDLYTVSDAFCPSSVPLIRTVSLEDQQEHAVMIPALPPCVIRQTSHPRLLLGTFDCMASSNRIEEEEEDDLRRQVGSNDYDRDDVRDGAPDEDERDEEEMEHVAGFYQQMTLQV